MNYKGMRKFGGVMDMFSISIENAYLKKILFVLQLHLNKTNQMWCLEDKPGLTRKAVRTDPQTGTCCCRVGNICIWIYISLSLSIL